MVTIVTATSLEARAARRFAPPGVRVAECGIGLVRESVFDDVAISCGLAGGLRDDLPTGTVLVPRTVRRPDGTTLTCDPQLVEELISAAGSCGCEVVDAPLLTSETLVYGRRRLEWASQGYASVDMETGLIHAPRVACVRVVLDTPQREISPRWLSPVRAMLDPSTWRDLPFLMREGPRGAHLAAHIVAIAVGKGI